MQRRSGLTLALLPPAVVAAALGLRLALAPAESAPPPADLSPPARARLLARARASQIPAGQLRAQLAGLDVLLVGEEHFYRETTRFLCELLEEVEGRRVTLLFELPSEQQAHVDEWVRGGASAGLAAAIREGQALPLGDILSWAHRHPERVARVVAMDENRARVFVNRALLRDTRNETMARAVLDARRERPGDLAVAYAGQMHVLLGGRYRYDREDRTPAGALLLRAGVPRDRLRSVLLSGRGRSPLDQAWPGPGVLAMTGEVGQEAWPYFIDYPVFRAASGRDLFDHFVHLGPLTRVGR